jgi:fluoride exporter
VRDLLYSLATNRIVVLSIGGAIGTNARYWLARAIDESTWNRGFPLGTFAINVSGSFILGLVGVIFIERLAETHRDWYLLLGTGFCGGYTTFSTFEWETFKLVRDGSWPMALANVLGSVAVGFLGVVLGAALAAYLFPQR